MNLTKDSEKVICYIYKMYLERRKKGNSKAESRRFEMDFYKSDKDLSKWCDSDISDCILELARNGYIKVYMGGNFDILDSTIIYIWKTDLKTVFQMCLTLFQNLFLKIVAELAYPGLSNFLSRCIELTRHFQFKYAVLIMQIEF